MVLMLRSDIAILLTLLCTNILKCIALMNVNKPDILSYNYKKRSYNYEIRI